MSNQQPNYCFYATILDSFTQYLKSEAIYEKYYGWSENPPMTLDEFCQKQFQDLIDRINRVPIDSEAADRGTAFNEVVDALIENRKPEGMEVNRSEDNAAYTVAYNNRTFTFPIALCREFSTYFSGALTQQRVEATLETCLGTVLVYGVIDELMPTSVHDIKTTGSYTVGKFKDHWQHIVYLYCLNQSGSDIRLFEYNITDFRETYTESYAFVPERDIPMLRNHCEDFIRFVEAHRDKITDQKIFGKP